MTLRALTSLISTKSKKICRQSDDKVVFGMTVTPDMFHPATKSMQRLRVDVVNDDFFVF